MKYISRAKTLTASFISLCVTFLCIMPAQAHHMMEGQPASNAYEGLLSGLAHPIIGIDHLAMILAIGILAAAMRPGFLLAVMFVLASLCGSGIHLAKIGIPGSEALVSLSVLAVGVLLAWRRTPSAIVVLGIAFLGGVFHGYAYAEAIVGSEPTPLAAYLIGFSVTELVLAGAAFAVAKAVCKRIGGVSLTALRPAGYIVVGVGLAMFATQIIAMVFPVSP